MDDIIYDLGRLGFSRNEARIYVALLSAGKARAGFIAQRTGISRATSYDVLKALQRQGLLNVQLEGNEQVFVPEPPSRIQSNLYLKQQKLDEQRRVADPLLLRLQVFHNQSSHKPKIRYIESVDGLRLMQQEYEAMDDDLIQILGYDSFLKLHSPQISKEHKSEMARRGKRIRSILVTDRHVDVPDGLNVEIVCLPKALVSIEGEMTVCGDKLALFSYASGLIAVEIHSKSIADTAKATLELAWKEAKRLTGGSNGIASEYAK
jgi:predicted DNA-binding transcriptional regulator